MQSLVNFLEFFVNETSISNNFKIKLKIGVENKYLNVILNDRKECPSRLSKFELLLRDKVIVKFIKSTRELLKVVDSLILGLGHLDMRRSTW